MVRIAPNLKFGNRTYRAVGLDVETALGIAKRASTRLFPPNATVNVNYQNSGTPKTSVTTFRVTGGIAEKTTVDHIRKEVKALKR